MPTWRSLLEDLSRAGFERQSSVLQSIGHRHS